MSNPLAHISGAASVRTARLLHRYDRVLRRRSPLDHPPTSVERLLIAIPHWRPTGSTADAKQSGSADERTARLLNCISSLREIPSAGTDIVVFTNRAEETEARLRHSFDASVSIAAAARALEPNGLKELRLTVTAWRPGRLYRHGFGLSWAHKPLFRAALDVGNISHLLYLEDDMLFGPANLDYWVWGRQCLHGTGLIPGFVRFERFSGDSWLTDLKSSIPRPHDTVPTMDDAEWFSMPNPYQALYVLDRALAIDHFQRSPSRSRIRSRMRPHDDLASASHGPIYDDAPAPQRWRTVVPLGPEGIHSAALVEHTSANYAADPSTALGSIRLSEVFDG